MQPVHRNEGTVNRVIDDSVTVLFGAPLAAKVAFLLTRLHSAGAK
jgi:hypothetical protein